MVLLRSYDPATQARKLLDRGFKSLRSPYDRARSAQTDARYGQRRDVLAERLHDGGVELGARAVAQFLAAPRRPCIAAR